MMADIYVLGARVLNQVISKLYRALIVTQEMYLTTSRGMSLVGGCDLGIPYERYLWWVHVRCGDPRVECLCGMKPQDGGAVEARGVGYPLLRRYHVLSL